MLKDIEIDKSWMMIRLTSCFSDSLFIFLFLLLSNATNSMFPVQFTPSVYFRCFRSSRLELLRPASKEVQVGRKLRGYISIKDPATPENLNQTRRCAHR